ncbi:MAG: hypothetical protein J2P31_12110, partial [Blastocatellia bacterium]|nr:hypothetical protein [Blastocatellia bacterium]
RYLVKTKVNSRRRLEGRLGSSRQFLSQLEIFRITSRLSLETPAAHFASGQVVEDRPQFHSRELAYAIVYNLSLSKMIGQVASTS